MNQRILYSNTMLVTCYRGFRKSQDKRVRVRIKKTKKNKK